MPVSIKDVARIARVSHSTVSRALRNTPTVNHGTAERIRQVAHDLGYRPNSIGRSLATRRTLTIGVVVTSVADPFIAEVIAGVEEVAQDRGYAVYLANSNANPEREINVVRSFQDRRVDGVLVMASRVGASYMPLLNELDVPIVLIDNQYPGGFVHSISIDDRGGARLAVGHLLELGHRRIAYIGDRFGMQSNDDRRSGYQESLAAAGLPFRPELVVEGDGKAEGGLAAMATLLALREPPAAVFCYNDLTAIGALRCLHAAGRRVPGEVSVVGFDDLPIASFVEPPLTTIRQPKSDMGRRAAAMMLALLAGSSSEVSVLVPGELVVRESTAPAG
jgi:DNA-binding LacI/PurR family transcriptional regulator